MFGSYLPYVVGRRAHVLFTLYVFAYVQWCPTHSVLCFCFVFHRLVYPMLPVFLDRPFFLLPLRYSLTFLYYAEITININTTATFIRYFLFLCLQDQKYLKQMNIHDHKQQWNLCLNFHLYLRKEAQLQQAMLQQVFISTPYNKKGNTVDSRYLEFDGTMENIRVNRSSTQEELRKYRKCSLFNDERETTRAKF